MSCCPVSGDGESQSCFRTCTPDDILTIAYVIWLIATIATLASLPTKTLPNDLKFVVGFSAAFAPPILLMIAHRVFFPHVNTKKLK